MGAGWTDQSYEGKKLRKIFKSFNTIVTGIIENKQEEKYEMMISMVERMDRIAKTNAKLIEVHDIQKRVDNHDMILKYVPVEILAQCKQKAGV